MCNDKRAYYTFLFSHMFFMQHIGDLSINLFPNFLIHHKFLNAATLIYTELWISEEK